MCECNRRISASGSARSEIPRDSDRKGLTGGRKPGKLKRVSSMSHSCEDIATDSVPDAPRPQKGNSTDTVNEVEEKETFPEEEDVIEEPKVQDEPKTKKENSKKTKTPRPEHSSPKPNIPNYGTASANMIWINNANNVHVGNVTINSVTTSSQASDTAERQSRKKKTTEIEDTCRSNEKMSEDDMDVVAEHVGREWKKLGAYLGYTEGQLDQFYMDHREIGLKEVIYKMLVDWKQYKADKACIGVLCKGLWKSKQYSAAEELTKLRIARAEKQS